MTEIAQTMLRFLKTSGYTVAAIKDQSMLHSYDRGVKPLLDMIDDGVDLNGYTVADKVIGKAAALLYVRLNATNVYAEVMSTPAKQIFSEYSIDADCINEVPVIMNRTETGFCPMESAVTDIASPAEAEAVIRRTLKEISIIPKCD